MPPLDPVALTRLTALDRTLPPPPWHIGRTTGRNIYMGDGPHDDIGKMDTPLLGEFVALARNTLPALLARLAELEGRP